MTPNAHRTVRLGALSAALLLALPAVTLPALAQTPPDAGQVLRELQRPQAPLPPPGATLTLPAEADSRPDDGQRFEVKAFRIEGATVVPAAELQPLVADLVGKPTSLGELRQAARRLTAHLRDRGLALARAYLPAQDVSDGIVTFQVLEGVLGKASVDNQSSLSSRQLEATVAAQNRPGEVLRSAPTDRALLLLADLPGAGNVSGSLRPGDAVGSSDLVIHVEPGKTVEGDVSLDDYGNRYTGQERANGHVAVNNPLGLGDRLDLRGTVSDERLAYGRAAYDAALGNDGLRAGAALSTSRYHLAKEFANLDATGTARSATLNTSWPAVRSLDANVWLGASLERRWLKDDIASTATDTRKSATVAGIEAYGDVVDSLGAGGVTNWRIGVQSGSLSIGSAAALALDAQGPRTDGHYDKAQLNLTRTQSLGSSLRLSAALAAQWADKNLDSSEKFVLGGAYGVRAYPQGEGTGDEGWLANVELRHDVLANLQAAAFVDAGHVRINHTAFAAGRNSQTLRGYGLSATGGYGAASLKLTLAWRDGDAATTAPDHRPRLWLQGGWLF